MNAQQGAALSLTGGLLVSAAGTLYGYAAGGKGKGAAQARDRAAMIQVAGSLGTAVGAGVLLWPFIRAKFNDQPQGPDGSQVESNEGGMPFLPAGAEQSLRV